MLNQCKNIIMSLIVCAFTLSAYANKSPDKSFDPNQIVGMFADQGYIGTMAGTKTMSEAHGHCLGQSKIGSERFSASDGEYHDAYKNCMKDFVPFKISGIDSAGACASQTVSWGQCQATIPATSDGASTSVQNSFDPTQFEGFATFQCADGALSFVSGGCSRAVKACEEGQIVNWPVTSPAWADESQTTTYRDRYGEEVHTPKGRCYARMPYSTSGEIHRPKPTTPEMLEPERYNMNGSTSPQRCFDSKWIEEPASGAVACEYIPKNCSAKTFTHNGCTFDLPAANHDTVESNNTPLPQNSLGTIEGYCFDGDWKVKALSCQVSCAGSIGDHTWSGSDTRACGHNGFSRPDRVTPGDNVVIQNVVDGMLGSVTYRCDNGKYTTRNETCEPKSCTGINASSWGNTSQCSHGSVNGNWSHSNTAIISSETSIFSATGSRRYQCQYGVMSLSAEDCDNGGDNYCDMTKPIGDCSDGRIVDGQCCMVLSNGDTECGPADGGKNDFIPPKSSFTPSIRYSGTCMNCSRARSDGSGEMYPYPDIPPSQRTGVEIVSGVTVTVVTGCSKASDCEVTESGHHEKESMNEARFEKTDHLASNNILSFSLTRVCYKQGDGTSLARAGGTLSVRNKVTGEVKALPYSITLTSWCGGMYER